MMIGQWRAHGRWVIGVSRRVQVRGVHEEGASRRRPTGGRLDCRGCATADDDAVEATDGAAVDAKRGGGGDPAASRTHGAEQAEEREARECVCEREAEAAEPYPAVDALDERGRLGGEIAEPDLVVGEGKGERVRG